MAIDKVKGSSKLLQLILREIWRSIQHLFEILGRTTLLAWLKSIQVMQLPWYFSSTELLRSQTWHWRSDYHFIWLHRRLTEQQHWVAPHSPAQHEFGVLAVDVFLHQLQQQRSHDVGVVFQFPMQSHCQQGGKVHLGSGVEVMTALQGTDKLQTHHHTHTQRNGQTAS